MAKSETNKFNALFVKELKRVAKELGIPEADVSKAQFFSGTDAVSEWELRKLGGFNGLKKMFFLPEDNLEVKYGSKLIAQHVGKIEKSYGQALFFEKELVNSVKEALKTNPILLHPPVKFPKRAEKHKRTIVAAISDTHFGSNISKEELNGINYYSWTVASRRMALYFEQIANYKPDHRKDTDLVIQLNGDIIAGQIHNQEWFVDLLTTQFAGTVYLLSQGISYLAQHFSKITVVCTPGNHGRNVGKADKGRATTQKWDSYENMIYIALREIMAQKHNNVSFSIPEAPFIVYKVQGHNVMQTHGDTVINVGNPGNSLNMNSISNQISRVNASDLLKHSEKVAVVSVGHVHVPTIQILENGCMIVINGCLSGTDPFAQSIGIHSNLPTQLMYEATAEHAVGDIRMIQVKGADKEERFDKIIKPFVGKF
jgi:hypothetical protein